MSYIPLPTDVNGNVLTRIAQHDIFDQVVTAARTNQITASFFVPGSKPSDYGTLTVSGGASATSSAGKAIFSSGTATTASAQLTSIGNIAYTPGFEIYSIFTTTWTTPTSANSTQFIGLWDVVNNGFYLGYNGTTFGVAKMSGGVQTFIPRSSWNGDPLDGSALSKFTRNGTPEAINFTLLNLFRIRFGWLGAAPILFEVATPDGNWVTFHTILEPNTTANTSIQNPNLPLSLQITKTSSDATNLQMTCACWAAGTAAPPTVDVIAYQQETWASSTTANTSVIASTVGAGDCSFSFIVTGTVSVGVVSFESSSDGLNWFPLHVPNLYGTPNVITSYDLSLGSISLVKFVSGYYQVRARLSTAIIGSGTVQVQLRPSSAGSPQLVQVTQSAGTNLHVNVDNFSTEPISLTGNAPGAVSVGTSSTAVLAANALRKGAVFTNTSNNFISFGLSGNAAVLYSGITLAPYGVWMMDEYTFTTGAIAAIASGAGSNLAVQEMQ